MIDHPLDFYDDPTGQVLKSRVPDVSQVPEFVKTAERLTPEEMDKLPDDVFALVAFDGPEKMRKFACVDKGNTALSVIYFLENNHMLPEEAIKTAAANLITACGWYDMEHPAELEKLALAGALMNVAGAGMSVAQGAGNFKKRQQALKRGMPGSEAMKVSELSGTHVMPATKTASMHPYVDITGQEPHINMVQPESGSHFCMEKTASYPIDTAEQVQRADAYFQNHRTSFSPFERHEYCVKLAARAEDLGLEVSDQVKDYGAKTTSPKVKVAVFQRMRHFREGTSEHGLLKEMMDKCASIRPEVMATTLERFDEMTGMDKMWDNGIPDPYASVFGKVAEAEWSFVHGNERIDDTRLKLCAKRRLSAIEEHFGEDLALEFKRDPKQIFGSLPLDSKRIIMRIAGQVEE